MTEVLVKIAVAVLVAVPAGVLVVAVTLGSGAPWGALTRSRAERIARAQFVRDFPQERPGFSSLVKDGGPAIVMISYGSTRPPRRRYYAVDVARETAALLEDDAQYRPSRDR